MYQRVAPRHVAGQRQHERHSVIGDLVLAVLRDVGHHDPLGRRRLQIHRVDPDAGAGDDPAPLEAVDQVRGQLGVRVDDRVGLGRHSQDVGRTDRGGHPEFGAERGEHLSRRFEIRERVVGDRYDRIRHQGLLSAIRAAGTAVSIRSQSTNGIFASPGGI